MISSCDGPETKRSNSITASWSREQVVIDSIKGHFLKKIEDAPNSIIRNQLKKEAIDTINNLISYKLGFLIKNCRVVVRNISVSYITGSPALLAEFYNYNDEPYYTVVNTKYWLELDFSSDKDLENNMTYKFIKNIKDGAVMTLDFMYLADAQWGTISDKQLELRVVPFPAGFDFNSFKKKNR